MSEFPTATRRARERSPAFRHRRRAALPALLAGALLAVGSLPSAHADEPSHGISIFGDLKYGPDFEHFDYASPEAVKGGSVTLATLGSYDNLNPFILKGQVAAGASALYDTLLTGALDEASSYYGLIAESVEVADDGRSVTFTLRPEAKWHDGVALTAEDVVWSFETLTTEGHPVYRTYYAAVTGAEAIDEHTVRFSFDEGDNAELPLIVGQLPVLPRHFWEGREFAETTLEPPLGSGPYRVGKIDPGRSIAYELVEDYWGADLPVNVGRNNFGTLRYDYYRDATVGLEALKAGNVDFRSEYVAKNWATAYDFPAVSDGRVVKEELPDESTQRMQAVIFNLRKPKYQDRRVREALAYAYDFEWMNENLFFGAYERTMSYFQNSEMQATGLPEGRELEILEDVRDQVPASLFTEAFSLPETDGSGNLRANYREALKLFREAGWEVKDGKMTNVESGEIFAMEWIISQPQVERLALNYAKALQRLGIDLKTRVIDSAQFQKRMEDFDFDVTTEIWIQSESPGNEQVDYWGSSTANLPGSQNTMGVENPAIDRIIERIIGATTREEQVAAARALDRVLLHERYLIPQHFGPTFRVAYWDKFDRPEVMPRKALGFDTWWIDPEKAAALAQ